LSDSYTDTRQYIDILDYKNTFNLKKQKNKQSDTDGTPSIDQEKLAEAEKNGFLPDSMWGYAKNIPSRFKGNKSEYAKFIGRNSRTQFEEKISKLKARLDAEDVPPAAHLGQESRSDRNVLGLARRTGSLAEHQRPLARLPGWGSQGMQCLSIDACAGGMPVPAVTCVSMCLYACLHVCLCVCMHVYICVYVSICMFTRAHIHRRVSSKLKSRISPKKTASHSKSSTWLMDQHVRL
jgi:hypothetical protein